MSEEIFHQYDGQISYAEIVTDSGSKQIGSEILKLSLFEKYV